MAVVHKLDCLEGQPRLEVSDLVVGYMVNYVARNGLEDFCKSYRTTKEKARNALAYCMNEQCVPDFVMYCKNCSKSKKEGKEYWKVARAVYRKEFEKPEQ